MTAWRGNGPSELNQLSGAKEIANMKTCPSKELTRKEIRKLLNSALYAAGVRFNSKGRPPSGWYRSSPGLTGIGSGRNRANCALAWKPRGPFIPLKIKKYVESPRPGT